MVEGRPAEWLNVVEVYDPLAKMRQSRTGVAMPGLTPGGNAEWRSYLSVQRAQGRSVVSHLHATSPLRLVVSRLRGGSRGGLHGDRRGAHVSMVTLGGGLVSGDAISLGVDVGPEATLVLTTQASTKVFRGEATQHIAAEVGGLLVVVPEPTACFRGASFDQRTDVSLGAEGSVVLLDGFTSGRPAYGERWDFARLTLRTTLSREGRLLLREAMSLDSAATPIAPRFGDMDAFFTIAAEGPAVASLLGELLAPHRPSRELVVASSRIGSSGALVRISGRSPAIALGEVKRRLRNLPDICGGDPWSGRR
jgi:urease accessory protein